MAEDDAPAGGGGPFEGPPIAGIPRPLAIGGALVLGVAVVVFLRRKKSASSSSTTTVITGSSSTGIDNAMLDAMLKDWQQHPGTASSSTGTGTGGGGGGTGPGSGSSGQGTSATGTSTPPTGPNPGTTTNESGQMHGISLAQAMYLFDTGNQPYVFDSATNQYVRWNGLPVAGQTFYAGPLNWQDALKNGNVVGGTKGHPILKSAATAAKKATAPKAKAPAKKPAPPRRRTPVRK